MNAKLAEIGAQLREARQAQQRSIEDLSQATLIHSRHLTALEEGCTDDLPEPFYIKHFIRKYANAVGLQGDELARQFWDTQPLPPLPPPAPARSFDLGSWWILPVLVGALMLGAVVTLAFVKARHPAYVRTAVLPGPAATPRPSQPASLAQAPHALPASPKPQPSPPASLAKGPHALPASPKPQPSLAASLAKAPHAKTPLAIAASASAASRPPAHPAPEIVKGPAIAFQTRTTEASWMQVIADGREVQSNVVPAGQTRKWTAMRSLDVRIGNPGSVYGTLGTRSLGLLGGKDSTVFHRSFLTAAAATAAKARGSGTHGHAGPSTSSAHAPHGASHEAPHATAPASHRGDHAGLRHSATAAHQAATTSAAAPAAMPGASSSKSDPY